MKRSFSIAVIGLVAAAFLWACTGDGPASATVDGVRYAVGVVRGINVADEDLSRYAVIASADTNAYFADTQTYAIRDVDPAVLLLVRAAPGLVDDAGSWGPFVGLWGGGQDRDACRYFTKFAPTWCE